MLFFGLVLTFIASRNVSVTESYSLQVSLVCLGIEMISPWLNHFYAHKRGTPESRRIELKRYNKDEVNSPKK